MRLFVYGTLQRGQAHHTLLGFAPWRGRAVTALGFGLVDLGRYPGLVRRPRRRVAGETYRVDDGVLERLDRFELHPHLFRRTEIDLAGGGSAWAYLLEPVLARDAPELPAGPGGIVRWPGASRAPTEGR